MAEYMESSWKFTSKELFLYSDHHWMAEMGESIRRIGEIPLGHRRYNKWKFLCLHKELFLYAVIHWNASADRLEECLSSAKQSVKHEVRQASERRLQLHSQ